jgi:hypothetical protein
MSTVGLISIGVLILVVGIGVGFLFGHTLRRRELTKASDVQDELNQYRRDVSDHFDQTAVHFQSIGQQYRDLYEHMAIGAGALCDSAVPGRELPFSPGAMLPPKLQPDEAAADANAIAGVRPATDIPQQVDNDAEIWSGEEVDVATDVVYEDIPANTDDTDDTVEAGESEAEPEVAAEGESASESIDDKRIYH